MLIKIVYTNGTMTINLRTFFPASASRLKKLIRVAKMDCEHSDQIITSIIDWITNETTKRYNKTKIEQLTRNLDLLLREEKHHV